MTPIGTQFFDDEQHEASRLKVEVYGKYLRPLTYKVLGQSYQHRLWLIDGFAGAGCYADGAPGSPLVAARFARQYNVDNASRGKRVALINVESDPATFNRLRENLGQFDASLVRNFHGRFQDHLPEILRLIGNEPALFFTDAFGMEGADIRLIEHILNSRGNSKHMTELLIHFSDRYLQRVAGYLHPGNRTAIGEQAGQSKLREMDQVFQTQWWRGAFTNPQLTTGPERCDAAAEIYMAQLRKHGVRYVHPVRMRDAYDASPRYRLIFTTRSAHGSYLMSDIAAAHEADLFKARFEGTFDIDWQRQLRSDRRATLEEEIHRWGLARGHATPEEIYLHFAPEYFGEWRNSDYDHCIRELVLRGGIDRRRPEGIDRHEKLTFVDRLQETLFGASEDEASSSQPG